MKLNIFPINLLAVILAAATGLYGEQGSGNPFAQAKFVPDIALILDTSFVIRDIDDQRFGDLSLPGFPVAGTGNHAADFNEPNPDRGFNLNYAELSLYSVVDPYFDLFAVFQLSSGEFSIEEAYFTTRRLPLGLKVKGGKFLSHFGRINSQHDHYWDFSSPPLIQSVFFGGNLDELGLRLAWVAPTDFFLQLAIELLQGENEMSFGRKGFELEGISVDDVRAPGIWVATVKGSFDLGNLTVLAGLSNARGSARIGPETEAENITPAFSGTSNIFGADLTLKYLFDSIRYLSLQAEMITRTTRGDAYQLDASENCITSGQRGSQAGTYIQAVSRLNKRLRLGARMDLLWKNHLEIDSVHLDLPRNLARYTVMAEWNPTEFSRLRLQYTYDRSRFHPDNGEWERQPVHELVFQVNITIGAHGAHAF